MLTLRHKFIFSTFLLLFPLALSAEDTLENITITEVGQDNEQEDLLKLSEAFGHFIGRNLKNPGINFDLERIIKGMRDGSAGKPPPLSDEEYERLMAIYQSKAYMEVSEQNLKAAADFMTKNAQKSEIVEIEPGKLQYQILEEGFGGRVKEDGTPMINYEGTFLDGTVFGSSEQAGGPITVPLDQTIPGFNKGLVGMFEGEKRRLFVHPDLGYGTSGQLPPNTMLIFDIEVLKADASENDGVKDSEEAEDDDTDIDLNGDESEDSDSDFQLPKW